MLKKFSKNRNLILMMLVAFLCTTCSFFEKNVTEAAVAVADDGIYCIKNVESGWMINVQHGTNPSYDKDGTNINLYPYDGTTTEQFRFAKYENGYKLYPVCIPERSIDIRRYGAKLKEGQKVCLWKEEDDHQYINLKYINDTEFILELANYPDFIIAPASKANASKTQKTLVVSKYTGKDYQRWVLCNTDGTEVLSHEHSSIACSLYELIETEAKDDAVHIERYGFYEICGICGGQFGEPVYVEEKEVSHTLVNGKCFCGYKDMVCAHWYQHDFSKLKKGCNIVSHAIIFTNLGIEKAEPLDVLKANGWSNKVTYGKMEKNYGVTYHNYNIENKINRTIFSKKTTKEKELIIKELLESHPEGIILQCPSHYWVAYAVNENDEILYSDPAVRDGNAITIDQCCYNLKTVDNLFYYD